MCVNKGVVLGWEGGREWVVKGASSGTTAEKLFSCQLLCVFIIAQNIGTVECQFLC